MKLDPQGSDERILSVLGERLARLRLAKNLSQARLAEEAGLGVRTVQRLEAGMAATHLSGFLRVCRVLGLLDRLEALVPDAPPSPVALLKIQGRTRKRASGGAARTRTSKTWTWGESS